MDIYSCRVCDSPDDKGIYLLNNLICLDCEKEIVNLDINDRENYEFYKTAIKDIWKENTIVF